MEKISINNLRPIFFQKNGFPKKEALFDNPELLEMLGVNIEDLDKYKRSYLLNLCNACIKAIRDVCREHHINFVDTKLTGMQYVKHGFTQKKEFIYNSLERAKIRKLQYVNVYKKVKQIVEEQLLLPFEEFK